MLSALYGVNSNTMVDYVITKHFNERKCVPTLIDKLPKDCIVIMDRGYFSKHLYRHFYNTRVHALFRLKCDANRTVKQFYRSSKMNMITHMLEMVRLFLFDTSSML